MYHPHTHGLLLTHDNLKIHRLIKVRSKRIALRLVVRSDTPDRAELEGVEDLGWGQVEGVGVGLDLVEEFVELGDSGGTLLQLPFVAEVREWAAQFHEVNATAAVEFLDVEDLSAQELSRIVFVLAGGEDDAVILLFLDADQSFELFQCPWIPLLYEI